MAEVTGICDWDHRGAAKFLAVFPGLAMVADPLERAGSLAFHRVNGDPKNCRILETILAGAGT